MIESNQANELKRKDKKKMYESEKKMHRNKEERDGDWMRYTLKFDSCRLRFINFMPSSWYFSCVVSCVSVFFLGFLCVCNAYTYGYFHTFTVVFLLVKLISPEEIRWVAASFRFHRVFDVRVQFQWIHCPFFGQCDVIVSHDLMCQLIENKLERQIDFVFLGESGKIPRNLP